MADQAADLRRTGAVGWADRMQRAAGRLVVWQQPDEPAVGEIIFYQVLRTKQDPCAGTRTSHRNMALLTCNLP